MKKSIIGLLIEKKSIIGFLIETKVAFNDLTFASSPPKPEEEVEYPSRLS